LSEKMQKSKRKGPGGGVLRKLQRESASK
jgi:hypothetical protein